MVLFIATASAIRDVKTVYFLEPVTGLPKPVFYQLPVTERPIVSGIIVTGHSALAISLSVDHLLLHGGRSPHTRRTDAVAVGQRTVAYQSGRGQREQMLCRRERITIVTPLSRPGSAKTAASVCLYSVYRKQERLLFTAALEQTSNVPWARAAHLYCSTQVD